MINEIKSARSRSGLSQRDFALALQISTRTLQEWEQGRRFPSGSARALINIALKHPDVIRENFEAQHKQKLRASAMLDDLPPHPSLLPSGEKVFNRRFWLK